jgi:hypothetical protein
MTRRPAPPLRSRIAVVVVAGLAIVAGMSLGPGPTSQAQRPTPRQAPAAAQVQAEVDAMIANGVPRNDPKVRMLEADARALEAAAAAPPRAEPVTEPGADRNAIAALADEGAVARTPAEARARATEMRSDQPAELGSVQCEPIPQLLSAREVKDAACHSVPQADGTSRYVAVTPAGRVLVVQFAPGGDVRRLPDTRLPAGTSAAQVTADTAGNLTVAPPGKPATSVDLG